MNWDLWLAQLMAILRLEWKKSFFSRRGLWIYLLALFPVLIFGAHAWDESRKASENRSVTAEARISTETLRSIREGMAKEQVTRLLGQPLSYSSRTRRGLTWETLTYFDGSARWIIRIAQGVVTRVSKQPESSLAEDTKVFATVFQYFFLRLAIFFGCVGIFMNLFRGEILDKSLHFYLLTPVRREVLMLGKYAAGLAATGVIFAVSLILQILALRLAHNSVSWDNYMNNAGWGHAFTYLGITFLGCAGYGAVFLAAGLFFKNPMSPAVTMLVWENANWFLPEALKKFSVIYYLQALCPVVAPPADLPGPLQLLVTTAAPIPAWAAIAGLLAVSAGLLFLASRRVRTLEINYSAD
jgi:ABC-type transport system involved in multi-copper enzyme maturation permease subunit